MKSEIKWLYEDYCKGYIKNLKIEYIPKYSDDPTRIRLYMVIKGCLTEKAMAKRPHDSRVYEYVIY